MQTKSCMMLYKLFTISAMLALVACNPAKQSQTTPLVDEDLNALCALMTGTFTSEEQSKSDSDYYNISLVMTEIWSERTDGKWLYVEQAVATSLDKPYRQRVYHLQHPEKNIFTSDIYTIKDALSLAGLQHDPVKQGKLTFDLLELKDGCTVTLEKKGDMYIGGTNGDDCPSDLRGAAYATTKIELTNGRLTSWDQGFDAAGTQVWGAIKGGYVFIRK